MSLGMQEEEIPEATIYEEGNLCCFKTDYVPSIKTHFIGHWLASLSIPIGISVFTLIVFVYATVVSVFSGYYWVIPIFAIVIAAFLNAYYHVILIGPGYFPFDWAVSGLSDTGTEGIVSNDDQFAFLATHAKPPRSTYFKTARRFVAKPDHICGWVASWIGKRNLKAFILMNFYGFLCCFTIVGLSVLVVMGLFAKELIIIGVVLGGLDAIVLSFGIMTFVFFFRMMYYACVGRTSWEEWNNIPKARYSKSVRENLADVFGPHFSIKCFVPTDPWEGMDTNFLMEGLLPYRDPAPEDP